MLLEQRLPIDAGCQKSQLVGRLGQGQPFHVRPGIVVVLLLELGVTMILVNLTCSGNIVFFQLLALTLVRIAYLVLRIYLFVILIYVLMSWISPGTYNPAAALLGKIAEPMLRPFRKYIPALGGFDLSALFALISIQALTMLLPIGGIARSMGCFSVTQLM